MKALKNQLSFSNFTDEFDDLIEKDKPQLIKLFEEFIDISDFIPHSFYNSYYSDTGHPRDYDLSSMISSLILQKLLSIPTTTLLQVILELSEELRDFCGFVNVPHLSQFSRFKTNFFDQINEMFHKLVDFTEPICDEINSELSNILISDTTGFEAYVKENNPKFFETILRRTKSYAKKNDNKDFDPYSYAYSLMPKKSSANIDITLAYLCGHYGYFEKSNIVTNGLGLVRHIDFYDYDFQDGKSPSKLKDKYDSKTLIPVLENYFTLHPNFTYNYFLGDSGFDGYDNYEYLYSDRNMIPIISLNPRNKSNLPKPGFNENGIPTCPYNPSLAMKFDGVTREKGRADRIKYLCPKSKKTRINGKTQYLLDCDNPCTNSKCGRIVQISVSKDYRLNSTIPRDSEKWKSLYKIRTVCERAIAQLKSLMCLPSNKLRKTISIKSDVLLAGITQLMAFIVLYKSNQIENPRAIKSLIA